MPRVLPRHPPAAKPLPTFSMDSQPRFDVFEPGDLTALVCMDVPELQRLVAEQLTELGYRVHTGLSQDDLLLKMRTHVYDVLVISEHLGGKNVIANPVLHEAVHTPSAQRRKQLVVLVGSSFQTGDVFQAFQQSVDLVVNLSDSMNLRPLIRRGVNRGQEFYRPLLDALNAVA